MTDSSWPVAVIANQAPVQVGSGWCWSTTEKPYFVLARVLDLGTEAPPIT